MSFVELLSASSLGLLVSAGIALSMATFARTYVSIQNHVDLAHQTQHAISRLTRDIRNADTVVGNLKNTMNLHFPDGSQVTYTLQAPKNTLKRNHNGNEEFLGDVVSLEINEFQRTPVGGTFEQYPTATVKTTKLIQLIWTTEKKGPFGFTSTLHTWVAKVVMRNRQ